VLDPESFRNEVSLDEGLAWDTSPLPKALVFAALTALAFAAVMIGSRRWHRLPSYAVGFMPVAVGLYFTFEQIDRILPAY
jgi:hypothetical protein